VVTVDLVNIRPPLPFVSSCPSALAPLLWAAALSSTLLPAQAGVGLQDVAEATTLAGQAARALAPAGARIVVLPGALDARLRLAPCARVQAFLPAGVAAWGRSRVGLRCVQGSVAWQVHLPVTVQVWAPAVVAESPLPAGAQLDASQLLVSEVDWAAGATAAHTKAADLAGRVLARPLSAGQAVRVTDLRPRQWFALGETVQIVAQGSGFAVQAEGQALGAGIEGQTVRVRTESGRIVTGLAAGQRRVELSL